MKKRILFIINPVSGVRTKHRIPDKINRFLDKSIFDYEIIYTQARGHATMLAQKAASENYDVVAVAGGDGSVNEVAAGLVGTNTALAILPMGSGNGLANHLGYKIWARSTLRIINKFSVVEMDACTVNGKYFFSLTGMGFDAYAAKVFDREPGRGLHTYVLSIIKSLFSYQAFPYQLNADNKHFEGKSFMINVCNSNQFGNNVKIAPDASVTDGLLNVCLVKDFPKWKAPLLLVRLVLGKHRNSKYVEYFKTETLTVTAPDRSYLHIDGEPELRAKKFDIRIAPEKLKVLVRPGAKANV